jgi:hypothetical protein
MSGRGGRSRGGLGIAAAAVPPAKPPPPPTAGKQSSLPPSNIFAAATRVSGRSPARGAPPRGGGSAAGPPAPRGRGTLRGGGPGVAVTRGASLGHASPPVGGRGGSPLGSRIGGSGGGLRSSPKPPAAATASIRGGKPGLSIISAVGVNKGGVKGEALTDKAVAGIAALSTTTTADLTVKSVIGAAAADRLDLKLCDFPETPPLPTAAEEGAVSLSSIESENDLSSSATVGDETHAKATTPNRRRRVFPKLNDNPEAPEVVDVENMKSSSTVSAGGQHSLHTAARRAAQRPAEAVAAAVVSADSLNVGAGDEPVKNGGGGPWVKDKGEIMNGLPAAAASTTNGYDVEATAVEKGEGEKEKLQPRPVKVVKAEVKTEVEAMVQVWTVR